MKFRANIDVIFEINSKNSEMVAQLWASGIVEGIQFNKPEVVSANVMVVPLMSSVDEPRDAEGLPDAGHTLPELERGD
jgi:hypothetical protein